MVRLVIDEQQERTLANASGVIEIANPSGRVIGRLRFEPEDSGFTDEEIRAALDGLRTTKRLWTTDEALKKLETLARTEQRP